MSYNGKQKETVRQWLIDNAMVLADKIDAIGYGEARPLADNGNFQGCEINRRVEVRVLR